MNRFLICVLRVRRVCVVCRSIVSILRKDKELGRIGLSFRDFLGGVVESEVGLESFGLRALLSSKFLYEPKKTLILNY
jgi:hypothetical protein